MFNLGESLVVVIEFGLIKLAKIVLYWQKYIFDSRCIFSSSP